MTILPDTSKTLLCMIAAKDTFKQTGQRFGAMSCPTCGGLVHWSVNGSRGHTSGKCETPNCVQWIE